MCCRRADLSFDAVHRTAKLAGTTNNEGDRLSVDGGSGALNHGHGNVEPRTELAEIERWQREAAAERS